MSEQEAEAEVEVPSKEELLGSIEEPGDEQPEYTDVEIQAMEMGWNPEGVEGKPNLSAEEFIGRAPLYDEMRALKKSLRKTQEGMEAMKKMQQGIRERERENTIRELKAQKREALENDNYDAVIEIDDKIAEVKVQEDEPAQNLVFEAWVDENEWYHQDAEMKEYADMIGAGYYQQNPKTEPKNIYDYVAKEVRARFPDKFGNPNRSKPTPVEGASRGRPKGGAKHKVADLPEADRTIMRTIVRSGAMTEAEYLKEYFGE